MTEYPLLAAMVDRHEENATHYLTNGRYLSGLILTMS